MCVFICVTPPGQTKNDKDLKFGTHTPIDLIEKRVFFLFRKNCRARWIFRLVFNFFILRSAIDSLRNWQFGDFYGSNTQKEVEVLYFTIFHLLTLIF